MEKENIFKNKYTELIDSEGNTEINISDFSRNLSDFTKETISGKLKEDVFSECLTEAKYFFCLASEIDHAILTSNIFSGNIASSGSGTLIGNKEKITKISTSGSSSKIINIGSESRITNSGNSSEIVNLADSCQISNSGNYSKIFNNAKYCKLSNSAEKNRIYNEGKFCQISESGFNSYIKNSGVFCDISVSGRYSKVKSTGQSSKISSSGEFTEIECTGEFSSISNLGKNGRAKGVIGTLITLAQSNNSYSEITKIKSARIDGVILKENTLYQLIKGEFTKVESIDADKKFRQL